MWWIQSTIDIYGLRRHNIFFVVSNLLGGQLRNSNVLSVLDSLEIRPCLVGLKYILPFIAFISKWTRLMNHVEYYIHCLYWIIYVDTPVSASFYSIDKFELYRVFISICSVIAISRIYVYWKFFVVAFVYSVNLLLNTL